MPKDTVERQTLRNQQRAAQATEQSQAVERAQKEFNQALKHFERKHPKWRDPATPSPKPEPE